MADLTDDELLVLQFEEQWWKRRGPRDAAVRRRFGLDPVAYRRRLDALIDRPEALAVAPLVVNRLRAQRASRGRQVGRAQRPAS